ncbi:YeeE/YedE family protein [Hydrogenophaga sp.]|uniref:YeeE/YedE family protein n=1 Tax=Hydrogenophaga sp. TaxID=1904254 RepID=UPI00272EEA09|nr:YeeE/YedE family protein [Hydrogenophaga sp.]MDP2019158.1 YeeE/YedE family protein [Hydrogenophaga sp.]MDP3168375.1 YeeE/YedE family protein [Hydrogenophaga sp.]
MNIDWANFTPWASLSGGILLGVASAFFILVNGRVLGISGILGGLLSPKAGDAGWRIAFLLGMFSAPLVYSWLAPAGFARAPTIDAGFAAVVAAGLLVGLGTRYGSGCTSGHGVCGLSRLSPRSLVATLAFMGAGFVMVFVVRHVLSGVSA